MLNWRLFDLTSFTRHSRAEIKQRIAKSLVYIFLLSALVSISGVATAPKADAVYLGTTYQLPFLSFGGGNDSGSTYCATDYVVVGVTFNQNPMVWGFKCAPLNSDLTISPVTSLRTSFPSYVFCPDGTAASGLGIISSGGYHLGLICKTPPGMSDTAVETEFIATAAGTVRINRTTAALNFSLGPTNCTSGDLLVGFHTFSNLWFDQLAGHCAPFQKFNAAVVRLILTVPALVAMNSVSTAVSFMPGGVLQIRPK